MRSTTSLFVGVASLLLPLAGSARAQPFFQPSGNSFDPEIGIVESGALLDATATVSADRKYVTLTMRPQLSTLIALREFTFQNGFNPGNGFVGFPGAVNNGVVANNAANGNGVRNANSGINQRPLPPQALRPAAPSVLERRGTTRISSRAR